MRGALVIIFTLSWAWPTEEASINSSKRGCQYGGKHFAPDSTFRPDACTSCRCPSNGGDAMCMVKDCKLQQHCLTWDNSSGDCCPQCLELGCRHTDGKVYEQGEVIKHEPCVRSYCPMGGGKPIHDVTSCPMSECVDPEKVPGVCCPVCPNGPNCQIGLLTLPIGQSVVIEGATCTCEKFFDADGVKRTLARCNKFR